MIFTELKHPFTSVRDELKQEEETLRSCDSQGASQAFIRFWESDQYCVVLGRSNKSETEVNLSACETDNIPIIQRCSGGGTVLQGPGCLNYSFIVTISSHSDLKQIDSTNCHIMKLVKNCLLPLQNNISIKGITDLAIGDRKFSGNAQRRLRYAILFHGTILYNFNLEKIEKYLAFPSKTPDYRVNRSHLDFVMNFPFSLTDIKQCFETKLIPNS
tara:strand:+ start:612 stop:1256 length:645 start_codon:yes stop_codon:yes gene_type:complete